MRSVSSLELDHILIAVRDLADAAVEIEHVFGLAAVEGGRHPDFGTANRIVPLGTSYLELVTVVDAERAETSVFGRWVAAAATGEPRLLAWAVRTDELDAVAARLGLAVGGGSRQAPNGEVLRWRTAGLEVTSGEPCLPFFIEWSPETRFPGLVGDGEHTTEVRDLQLAGDAARIAGWLGDHALPITIEPGPPSVRSLVLAVGCALPEKWPSG